MKILVALLFGLMIQGVLAENGSVYNYPLKNIDGEATSLGAYKGKVILLVNVASQCGYTPQYKGLQAIYEKYKDRGLTIIGVPCNDFGAQEPGTNEEIKQFCSSKYSVTFPMMDKIHVKGPEQDALYARLTNKDAEFPGDIKWNFNKFLIGRDGKVLKRFESKVTPESKELTDAIEQALASK
jgi:glutathione peroxidase